MPSRKRAKGKARKAKAQESNCNLILHKESACRHGCDIISKDDICYKFVEQFEVELKEICNSQAASYLHTLFIDTVERMKARKEYRIIWDSDEETQQKLQSLFINLGVNLLLKTKADLNIHSLLVELSTLTALAAISCHHDMNLKKALLISVSKEKRVLRDLYGLPYDVIKFFHKRISCQCLKKMYINEKTKKRYAACVTCRTMKERRQLFLCSCCLYSYYCSVECQTKHWPKHQKRCKVIGGRSQYVFS